eukprot:5871245-Pyramimonas_sp.AAC.1
MAKSFAFVLRRRVPSTAEAELLLETECGFTGGRGCEMLCARCARSRGSLQSGAKICGWQRWALRTPETGSTMAKSLGR